MTDLKQASLVLKEILGLRHEPVAVKFFKEEILLNGFSRRAQYGGEYCEMIINAALGKKTVLRFFKADCKAAAWTLGIRVPPDKLTLRAPTDTPRSIYSSVASCPLAEAPFEPDVVIIDATPAQLIWITLIHETGRSLDFNTGIAPGTPVDTTILSFPVCRAKGTTSSTCMKCHIRNEPFERECMLGFPVKDLDNIVHYLEKLKQ